MELGVKVCAFVVLLCELEMDVCWGMIEDLGKLEYEGQPEKSIAHTS